MFTTSYLLKDNHSCVSLVRQLIHKQNHFKWKEHSLDTDALRQMRHDNNV